MHLLLTRPQADSRDWRTKLQAYGATVTIDPLLTIELLPPAEIPTCQALVATSRNALRALARSPALPQAIRFPIFTVGPATTALARDLGFTTIHEGPASAHDLVPVIVQHAKPAAAPLIQLAGDKLAFDLATALAPAQLTLDRLTVYRSMPASSLQEATIRQLASGAIDTVMLMSPLTARTFASLTQEAGLFEQCQRLVYVCLSNNVAEALAPLAPSRLHVAGKPSSQAVFTLIETLLADPKAM